jgi:hypothetical protein
MSMKHPRISVTCDAELSEALRRAATILGAEVPRARLVHHLAVRGAGALVDEAESRAATLEELALRSTDRAAPLFGREVLRRADEDAWGYEPDEE